MPKPAAPPSRKETTAVTASSDFGNFFPLGPLCGELPAYWVDAAYVVPAVPGGGGAPPGEPIGAGPYCDGAGADGGAAGAADIAAWAIAAA